MNFRIVRSTALLLLLVTGLACNQSSQTSSSNNSYDANLSNTLDSLSFALGYQNGEFLANEGATDFNYEAYLSGFVNGMNKNESLTNAERNSLINDFRIELTTGVKQRNLEEGQAFLAENRSKEGVIETESGLQYKVLKEGTGKSPNATSTVIINYEGKLLNGTYFDTNNKELAQQEGLYDARREPYGPLEYPLNQFISGWIEGLQLMKEGAIYEFYIPSDLAYGENVRPGGIIKANSTLIFKVELIEVK